MINQGIGSRVKIQDIIGNQLPSFILDENPKTLDFINQYYISQEYQSGPVDITDNLDQYLKFDNLVPEVIIGYTDLQQDVPKNYVDSDGNIVTDSNGVELPTPAIFVSSTKGFPEKYGLLKINDEVITYKSKTETSFVDCVRGFSGITNYHKDLDQEELVFLSSSQSEHKAVVNNVRTKVENLSSLFLKEFYSKLKYTFAPGFEDKTIHEDINARNFLKEIKSFYESKGTEKSISTLTKVLFGKESKVLNLENYLLKPSVADFSRRKILVAEEISGDITKIVGQTIKKSTDSNISAVVSELESFTRNLKKYHRLSLYIGNDDYSSIQGEFSITPNTKSIEKVTPNLHDSEGNDIGKVITVDSTIGFAKEGTIYSGNNTISYTDKSVNQFLGCTGISETISSGDNVRSDETYVSYENGDVTKKVEFRITGVLSGIRNSDKLSVSAYKNQKLKVQTVGELVSNPSQNKTHKEVFSNSWIYNASSGVDIESIDGSSITLKDVIDNTKFKIGDRVEIVSKSSGLLEYPKETDEIAFIKNISIDNTGNFQKSIIDVNFNSFSEYNSNLEYSLRRVLNKSHSDIESISFKYGNDSIISDVQNVYFDSDFAYVASNSLPSSEITEENQYRDENRDNKSFLYLLNLTKNLIRSEITNSTQFSDQITDDTALSGEGNEEYTSIIFESKVDFITGDIIRYNTDSTPITGLSIGNYFAKVIRDSNPDIDGKKVKLFLSLVDLSYDKNPVRFSATQGSIIGSHSFTLTNQSSSYISPKKVFKKFPLEFDSSYTTLDSTDIGSIGLLINGVEIENYKSNDNIYYGPLESVYVVNKGSGYDIIKPPKITVSESTGDDALVTPTITGTIEEILVDPQNFDVGSINSIKITGGNFSGGKFEPVIGRSKKSLSFSGTSEVGVFANSLVLDENHGLSNGDEVTYLNDGNPSIPLSLSSGGGSLLNGTSYFVSVDNTKTIRLYGTYENAISRTNNLVFDTSSNVGGLHRITIGELKNNLTEILVIDGGTVSSKKLIVKPENVSTLFDTINFKGHGFSTGELVSYEYETTSISGLNVDNQYYVVTIDEDSFKLCDAGINGLDTTNFNDRTFASFSSSGSGYQTFKYPDIKVSVDYSINGAPIAISTTGNIDLGSSTITNIDTTGIEEGQNVVNSSLNLDTSVISVGQNQVTIGSTVGSAATGYTFDFTSVINLTPVAKGKIESVQLYDKGTNYGSSILNFQLKPDVKVEKGEGAQIKVIIINGRVDIASVQFPGYNYFSTPTLNVYDPTGAGSGAKLRAVVSESGSITDVKILSKGIGYSDATIVEIIDSGSGATFDVELRSLGVNKVEKIPNDKQYECLTSLNGNLQYSISGYFKKLRESFNEKSTRNSGIIGWAFDGNPIYGPYGISDAEDLDSTIKLLTSGYTANLNNIENRPPASEFPLGFFIDDYAYTGQGDLDEHNGRFEKTREYPNGTYVYHATIASENPVFPYFIGNAYKSKYINENKNLTQYFDFNNSELKRNIYPYGLSQDNFSNDFILESNKIEDQKISVESVTEGYIDDIEIISSGDGYKVGQFLDFDNTGTEGGNAIAKVESVKGKEITQVTTSVESFIDSVLTWNDEKIKITTADPNLLEDKKYVSISGITTSSSNIYKLNNTTNQISIIKNGSTPLIASVSASDTEIYVSHIPDNVSVGNSITIESETLEILNISKSKNILRVNRGSSTSYDIGSIVNFKNYSFTIDAKLDYFDSKVNKKVYFNSTESVGVGTISGIGFNTSFTYGNETIERSIPAQRIYIENHPFKTNDKVTFYDPNNSGTDKLKYIPVSGNSADGVDLPQTLYVVNASKNTIGIKTGIGTDSNGDEFSEVFFTQSGLSTNTYSFTTNYDQEVADVKKITTTVSLSTAANISTGDIITLNVQPNLNVGIGTSTVVKLDNIAVGNIDKILATDVISIDVSNVDINENIMTLSSHPFKTGDKVYYYVGSNSSIDGLVTEQSYFVSKIDNDRFKLCPTYEGSLKNPPNEIDLLSTTGSAGSAVALYNVHPQIRVTKGNNIVFDTTLLSSLEEPKIFRDQKFNHEFVSTGSTSGFNIIKGTNSLTINYDSNIPERLYYNLETSGYISTSDTEVKNYNEILFEDSYYSDTFEISSVGTDFTSFTFEMTEEPERNSYLKADCTTLEYATTSTAESGPVNSLELVSGGSGYKKIPTISGIDTTGNDFSGLVKSKTIGKINQVEIVNPGFDYSSDKTLSPSAFISPKVTLTNSNTLNTIEVVNGGNSITGAPTLEIVDKKTGIAINSGLLQPIVSGSSIGEVEVLSQPFGLPEDIEVYAVNNSQGLSVNKVISNNTGIFTCVITTPVNGFSVSPLNVGDKVFVEGIQIINSTSSQLGYNSKNHGYQLFDVQTYSDSQTTPGISQDEVVLSIPNVSGNTGIALTVQPSSASLIKESNYPTFKATTKPSFFQKGEKLLINGRSSDLVVVSQSNLEDLEIFGNSIILADDILSGESSAVIAKVKQLENYDLNFEIDFGSDRNIGWQSDVGKLGLSNQVLPDNDYYQNLSYSVRSTIEWDDLKTPLNNLAHTSGTKNFADTEIISEIDQDLIGVSIQSPIDITLDIVDEHRVDTIFNFDFARDVEIFSEGDFVSSRMIEFKTFDFVNYIAMESNRVLIIDDIKEQFSTDEFDPALHLDLVELTELEGYNNYTFKISGIDGDNKIQLTDVIVIGNGDNIAIAEKQSISNSGGVFHEDGEVYADVSLYKNEFGKTFLRFTPTDPYDTELDIKYLDRSFIPNIVGVGTISGFEAVQSKVSTVLINQEPTILSFNKDDFESLHVTAIATKESSKETNFIEAYVIHDGTDVTVLDYYFDTSEISFSLNPVGIFTGSIVGSDLQLKFINTSDEDVILKTRVVGFNTQSSPNPTQYRFNLPQQTSGNERSLIYRDERTSGAGTTIEVLDSSANNLYTSDFDSIKSLVQIEQDGEKTLHQVLLLQSGNEIYVQQGPFLTTENENISGIGTFGGKYDGSEFKLLFHPSNINDTVFIHSVSEVFYTDVDIVNDAPDLEFGPSIEKVKTFQYFAINGNRINKKDFLLNHQGTPIFAKRFDPSEVLDKSEGIFTIKNHFFSDNEEVEYSFGTTFLGVTATGLTTASQSLVSPITISLIDENSFKLRSNGTLVNGYDESSGVGNDHQLSMVNNLNKSLITINNIAQTPLVPIQSSTNYTISNNPNGINDSQTLIPLNRFDEINIGNVLKVGDEYMVVSNVGMSTNINGPISGSGPYVLVEVDRGSLGSDSTNHAHNSEVTLNSGSYNIVGQKIHFTEAPRGNNSITRDGNYLVPSRAEFGGRVFLRKNYDTNDLYDDVSSNFDGIENEFTLTVDGANTTGIGTEGGSGLVFINGIYQSPTTENNPSNNFRITEDVGITTIVFTGITTLSGTPIIIDPNDINQNQIPRGGIIVSLGSTGGIGYAPLVGASVTGITTDGNGTITDLQFSDYGSGYYPIGGTVDFTIESTSGSSASINGTIGAGGSIFVQSITGGSGYHQDTTQIIIPEPSYSSLSITGISRLGQPSTDTGIGLSITVDVGEVYAAGIGSTVFGVSGFNITKNGYAFKKGDKFTPVGLVTAYGLDEPIEPFVLSVEEVFTDNFAAWNVGQFTYIDSIKTYQDGIRTRFPLYQDGELISFEIKDDSLVDIQNVLFIVVNGIIQEPVKNYSYDGGSAFAFTEPPKPEDNVAIFVYRGTIGLDDGGLINVVPQIENGDQVQISKYGEVDGQEPRLVSEIISSDVIETDQYYGSGIDETYRPVSLIKQKADLTVRGEVRYKTRQSILSQIYPTARIIKDIGGTTGPLTINVDNSDLFTYDIGLDETFETLIVDDNASREYAEFDVTVTNGSIAGITVSDGGSGYTPNSTVDLEIPNPSFESPNWPTISSSNSVAAAATATVDSTGIITFVSAPSPAGAGYTSSINVFAPLPDIVTEKTSTVQLVSQNADVVGVAGTIVAIFFSDETLDGVTSPPGNPRLTFILRRSDGIDWSTDNPLVVGDHISIRGTSVGSGHNSMDTNFDGSSGSGITIGIGTTCLDNIYQVSDTNPSLSWSTSNNGYAWSYALQDGKEIAIETKIESTYGSGLSEISNGGIGVTEGFVGEFSFGKITLDRTSPIAIGVSGRTVDAELSEYPIIQRRTSGLRETGSLEERT